MSGALDGWGALVTGGGSGIGFACAQRLAADGAHVVICGRTESKLTDAVERIAAAVPDATVSPVVADVTDEAAVQAVIEAAASAPGGLRIAVSNAGGSSSIGPVASLDVNAWTDTLALNVTGLMLVLKHGTPKMVAAGGGSVVGISSLAGHSTHRWFGAYGPAKAGIDQLCRQAADELGGVGVRVNSVAPGLIATELMGAITDGGPVHQDYLVNTPLGRHGEPEDVAELVRFLSGPESSWITGQVIGIDGGQSLRRGPDFRAAFEPMFGDDALDGRLPT